MSRSSVQIRPLAPCKTVCFGRNGRFFVFSEKLYFRNYQRCPLFVPYCLQKLVPSLNKTESTQHGFFFSATVCLFYACLTRSIRSSVSAAAAFALWMAWLYTFVVVAGVACPRRSATVVRGTPPAICKVAFVCPKLTRWDWNCSNVLLMNASIIYIRPRSLRRLWVSTIL